MKFKQKKLDNVTLHKGDVLLNITGASVARSCLLPDYLAGGRVNQHVSIVRCDPNRMLPRVLNSIFTSDSYQRFLLEHSRMLVQLEEAITKRRLRDDDSSPSSVKPSIQICCFRRAGR